jgi:hypothetical protein
MVAGKYQHDIQANLANGRVAIDEFLRVTADPKDEVDPQLARDVIALARELGAVRIVARAQEAVAKLHAEFNDRLNQEAELQLSTAATERRLRSLSIPKFVAVAGRWTLELPVLYRSVPDAEDSADRAVLFRFFVECLNRAHYSPRASLPFGRLPVSEVTGEDFDALECAEFDWRFSQEGFISALL